MKTKDQVLELLSKNSGEFLSGQQIADEFFVTRAAIWKAIKALQNEGHEIEAVTNKGYRIANTYDAIDTKMIENLISSHNIKVFHYTSIDSTNDMVRRLSNEYREDLLVIADSQTNGRGRRGRNFYSPDKSGLYMSILIHTDEAPIKTAPITGIAASSVAKAIDKLFFNDKDTTRIKWVNDIFLGSKKIAGILTEAFFQMEDEESSCIIIGFGINISSPREDFPKELKKIAGAITNNKNALATTNNIRSALAAMIINNLFYYMSHKSESIKIYQNKSMLIGNYVKINSFSPDNNSDHYAKVTGINNKYHLLIEYENGSKDELSSGEVSVVKY